MWKKLSLKCTSLYALNAPASFGKHLAELHGTHRVHEKLSSGPQEFLVAFLKNQEELRSILAKFSQLVAEGDAVVWCAYPKKSSKLSEDLSRDVGFQPLGELGDSARLIAVVVQLPLPCILSGRV
jgi:hypothetical protein